MSYNRKELQVQSSAKPKQNPFSKDIIVDPRGLWDNPGPVRVPGNNITTEGMQGNVMAYPQVGSPTVMTPNNNYSFDRNAAYVDEVPMFNNKNYKDLYLNEEQIAEYKKGGCVVKELPQFQEGGKWKKNLDGSWTQMADNWVAPFTPGDGSVKAFMKNYIKSDTYKNRLKSSNYPNPEDTSYDRQVATTLAQEHTYPTTPSSLWENIKNEYYGIPHSPPGAAYLPQSHFWSNKQNTTAENALPFGDIVLYKDQAKKMGTPLKDIAAHEYGHASLAGEDLNEYDKNQILSRLNNNKRNAHDSKYDENYSDLNAARYDLYTKYNLEPTQNITIEDIKKLKKESKNFTTKRLFDNYSEEDLLWMLNNIASNNSNTESSNSLTMAKEGGSYMDIMLDENQIANYQMNGFVVEKLPQLQEGGGSGGNIKEQGGYEYKKNGDKYLTRKKGSENWIESSGEALSSIKYKIYGEGKNPETSTKKEAAIINRMRSTFHAEDDEMFWSTKYEKLSPKEQQIHDYSSQLKRGDITHDPKSSKGKAFETYINKVASPEAWMKLMPQTMGQVFDASNDPNKFKSIKKSWGNITPEQIEITQDRGSSFDRLTNEDVEFANNQSNYMQNVYDDAEVKSTEYNDFAKQKQSQEREQTRWETGVDPITGNVMPQWEIEGVSRDQYYEDFHKDPGVEMLNASGLPALNEFTSIPAAARIWDNPKGTWDGIKQTGQDIAVQHSGMRGADSWKGEGINPLTGKEYWSGVDRALDALAVAGPVLGVASKVRPLAKGLAKVNKVNKGKFGDLSKKPFASYNSRTVSDIEGVVADFGYKPPLSFSEKMKTLVMNKSNKQKFLAKKTVDDAFDYADRAMKDPEYLKRFEDIKSMTPSTAVDKQNVVNYIRTEVKAGRQSSRNWNKEEILKMSDDEISSNFVGAYRYNTSGIGVEELDVPQYLNRTSKIPQQTSVQHLKDGIKIESGPTSKNKIGSYTQHVDENLGKKGTELVQVETKNLGDLASVTVHEILGHGKTFGPITLTQKEKELLKSVFKTNNNASSYIKEPTEVMARIDEIRFTLNYKDPFKTITEKDLLRFEKMLNPRNKNSSLREFISNVDKKELAKVMNKMYLSAGAAGIGAATIDNYSRGGELEESVSYMDLELDNNQIANYQMGGFVVEELPQFQDRGEKQKKPVKFKPKKIAFTTPHVFKEYDPNAWYGEEHYEEGKGYNTSWDDMQRLYEEGNIDRLPEGGWDYANQIKPKSGDDYQTQELRDRYSNIQNWMQGAFGATDTEYDINTHWKNKDSDRYRAAMNKLYSDTQALWLSRYPGVKYNPTAENIVRVKSDGTISNKFKRKSLDLKDKDDAAWIREQEKEQGYVAKPYTLEFDETVNYGTLDAQAKQSNLSDEVQKLWKEGYEIGFKPDKVPNLGGSNEDLEAWLNNNRTAFNEHKKQNVTAKANAQTFADKLGITVEELSTEKGYAAYQAAQKNNPSSMEKNELLQGYQKYLQPDGYGVTWQGTDAENRQLKKNWYGAPTGNSTLDYITDPTELTVDAAKVVGVGAPLAPLAVAMAPTAMAVLGNPIVQSAGSVYGLYEGAHNVGNVINAVQEGDYWKAASETGWAALNLFGGTMLGSGLIKDLKNSSTYLKGKASTIASINNYLKASDDVKAFANIDEIKNTNVDQWQIQINKQGLEKHFATGNVDKAIKTKTIDTDVIESWTKYSLDEQSNIISKLDNLEVSNPVLYKKTMIAIEKQGTGTSGVEYEEMLKTINREAYPEMIKQNPDYYQFVKNNNADIKNPNDIAEFMEDSKNVDAYIKSQQYGIRGVDKKSFNDWQKSLPAGHKDKGKTIQESLTEVRSEVAGRNGRNGGLFISNSPQLQKYYTKGADVDDAVLGIIEMNTEDALKGLTGIEKLEGYKKLSRGFEGIPKRDELVKLGLATETKVAGKPSVYTNTPKYQEALDKKRLHELEWQHRDQGANAKDAKAWAEANKNNMDIKTSQTITYNDLKNNELTSLGIKWLDTPFDAAKASKSGESLGAAPVGVSERRVVDSDIIFLEKMTISDDVKVAKSLNSESTNIRTEHITSQFFPAKVSGKTAGKDFEYDLYTNLELNQTTPALEEVNRGLKQSAEHVELETQLAKKATEIVDLKDTKNTKITNAKKRQAAITKKYTEAIKIRNKIRNIKAAAATLYESAKTTDILRTTVAAGETVQAINNGVTSEPVIKDKTPSTFKSYKPFGRTKARKHFQDGGTLMELDETEIKEMKAKGFMIVDDNDVPNLNLPQMHFGQRNINPFSFIDSFPLDDGVNGLMIGAGANFMFDTPLKNLRAGFDLSATNLTGIKDGKPVFNEFKVNTPSIKLNYTLPNKKR